MKRFHVHLHVQDLAQSLRFYRQLFAAEPARVEADYAKWMLEDPPVNFAISTRGSATGIDHLGIQTDDPAELAAMKARAEAADLALLDEGASTCCYARSEKHWVTDPQGIAWEHFHTLGNIPVFREGEPEGAGAACCTPAATATATPAPAEAGSWPSTTAAAPAEASACCAPSTPAAAPVTRGKPLGIAINAAPAKTSCC